jgi:hypothetical protein
MLLPVAERRRLMAEQARQMMTYYEQTASERQAWQAGDFEYYWMHNGSSRNWGVCLPQSCGQLLRQLQ